MGFIVEDEIKVDTLGISVSNAYVTFKGGFIQSKNGMGPSVAMTPLLLASRDTTKLYVLYGKYFIYARKDSSLQPLKEDYFCVYVDVSPTIPLAQALYNALKAEKFEGLTITDDL